MAPQRPKRLTATILDSRFVNDEIKWFSFKLSEPITFFPGQYVSLRFPGELRYHAFSIASSPAVHETIELVIKREKEFTTKLLAAPNGTDLELLGPIGNFLEQYHGDLVMIAGGVGVTPFISVLRNAADTGDRSRHYWLFYSCRTRGDIFNEQELRTLPQRNPNIHVVLTLTRETPEAWDGELGRVDENVLKKHLGTLDGKTYSVCGPTRLIDCVAELLLPAGIPKERILTESWG